jgi:hypothetical protein
MTRQELDAIFARVGTIAPGLLDTLDAVAKTSLEASGGGATFLQSVAPLFRELSPQILAQLLQTARDAVVLKAELQRMLAENLAANTGK